MKTNFFRTATLIAVILGGAAAANAGGLHGPGLKGGLKFGHGHYEYSAKHMVKHGQRHGGRYDHRPYGKRGKRHAKTCLWPHEIRRKLRNRGWYGVRVIRFQPNAFIARASRPSGLRFRIKVNRCRGRIVNAVPIGYRGWY